MIFRARSAVEEGNNMTNTTNETNMERLRREGVIDPSNLTPEHIESINGMSPEEVEALVKFKGILKAQNPLQPNKSDIDGTTDAV
jgi:hypothetical protein